ncbi:MAG: MarR family transcriptional regulator [Crocosphaera sp.]
MVNTKKVEIYYSEDDVLNVFPKPKKYLKDDHLRCFSQEAIALGIDRDLSGTDLRVFLIIIGNLGYENILNISQKQLADQSGICQQDISKSLKKLISKGYLEIIDKIGRRNVYMFNPNVAFRSRAKNLKELKHAWDKQIMPNTKKYPIDLDTDLEPDLEDKLDDRVSQLSKQFDIPPSKLRQMILSLVNQALNSDDEELELPY